MSMGRAITIIFLSISLYGCSLAVPGNGGDAGVTEEPPATIPVATGEIAVPSPTSTITAIPAPTRTLSPSETPVVVREPTATETEQAADTIEEEERESLPPYVVQPGSPVVASNFVETDLGCNYLGIGGQVFNIDGEPVIGLIVEARGLLDGEEILRLGLTGSVPSLGPGGFVIQMADHPLETEDSFWIQLHDVEGNDLSERITFPTYSDCSKNLILINFMEISASTVTHEIILPVILNR